MSKIKATPHVCCSSQGGALFFWFPGLAWELTLGSVLPPQVHLILKSIEISKILTFYTQLVLTL